VDAAWVFRVVARVQSRRPPSNASQVHRSAKRRPCDLAAAAHAVDGGLEVDDGSEAWRALGLPGLGAAAYSVQSNRYARLHENPDSNARWHRRVPTAPDVPEEYGLPHDMGLQSGN
jgi:hypothetical protein